jgi:hypothetical protein
VVESTALEMRHTGNRIGGSNPSLSASDANRGDSLAQPGRDANPLMPAPRLATSDRLSVNARRHGGGTLLKRPAVSLDQLFKSGWLSYRSFAARCIGLACASSRPRKLSALRHRMLSFCSADKKSQFWIQFTDPPMIYPSNGKSVPMKMWSVPARYNTLISPADGEMSPAAILRRVDLPHPVGPTIETNSP